MARPRKHAPNDRPRPITLRLSDRDLDRFIGAEPVATATQLGPLVSERLRSTLEIGARYRELPSVSGQLLTVGERSTDLLLRCADPSLAQLLSAISVVWSKAVKAHEEQVIMQENNKHIVGRVGNDPYGAPLVNVDGRSSLAEIVDMVQSFGGVSTSLMVNGQGVTVTVDQPEGK